MDDEMRLIKDTERASRAEALLKDELLTSAFAYIDTELINRWRMSKDAEARDRIWQATQIAQRVQDILRLYITNGKVAKRILDDLEGKRSRKAA